jgi:hypothetical protein
MVSEELPVILARWHKPPRAHASGTHTKAARDAMQDWAVDTVTQALDSEMRTLKTIMVSPQEDLSEESLLSVKWESLISGVKSTAPLTWQILRHVAYTKRQESRNNTNNPDAVRHPFLPFFPSYVLQDVYSLFS